jgi:hypothetical protein
MTSFDAERDLLFGTLAFQTGLIDQIALESACRARAGDEEKTLARILVDQGALDDEGKVSVVSRRFRVGCEKLAQDRLRAIQIREGMLRFADVPGYLRLAKELRRQSVRCGMIPGVDPENLLGLAHRLSSQT